MLKAHVDAILNKNKERADGREKVQNIMNKFNY